jgi:hypothetical protein
MLRNSDEPSRDILLSWQQDDNLGESHMAADIRERSSREHQREVIFNHQDVLILSLC